MIISTSHRFVFVHVPKTGGTSVQLALGHLGWSPPPRPETHGPLRRAASRIIRNTRGRLARLGLPAFGPPPLVVHSRAELIRAHLTPAVYDLYFSFAFVRNPWDRLVSQFEHRRRIVQHADHGRVMRMSGFAEFVRWFVVHRPRTQLDKVCGRDGTILVTRVARFESLAREFAAICDRLGIKAALGHENASARAAYHSYYDAETRRIVASHFAPDIERFGYSFE